MSLFMKRLQLLFVLFLLLGAVPSFAQKALAKSDTLVWYTSLEQAQKLSLAKHKPIFGFFTGSDWCGWCRKLQNDVFAKPEFIKWARQNVILLELDFPRRKQLSPELVQQNNNLQQAFKVTGYPTVWLFYLNKDEAAKKMTITALGSLGYPGGAVAGKEEVKFLGDANLILANNKVKKGA